MDPGAPGGGRSWPSKAISGEPGSRFAASSRAAAVRCLTLPIGAGSIKHAIRIDLLDVVNADVRRERAGRQIDPLVVGHAQQALGQSAQGLRIDLVGTAPNV